MTGKIIECAYAVSNGLGIEFLEKVYENALAQCLNYLRGTGLRVCLLINFQKPKLEINAS